MSWVARELGVWTGLTHEIAKLLNRGLRRSSNLPLHGMVKR